MYTYNHDARLMNVYKRDCMQGKKRKQRLLNGSDKDFPDGVVVEAGWPLKHKETFKVVVWV